MNRSTFSQNLAAAGAPSGFPPQVDLDLAPLKSALAFAAAQARAAYTVWNREKDAHSYAIYRAYADRADAAQDELASHAAAPRAY